MILRLKMKGGVKRRWGGPGTQVQLRSLQEEKLAPYSPPETREKKWRNRGKEMFPFRAIRVGGAENKLKRTADL